MTQVALIDATAGDTAARETVRQIIRLAKRSRSSIELRDAAAIAARGVDHRDPAAMAEAMRGWVQNNIEYRFDPADVDLVQSPELTLINRVGDCDDQVALLAAMLSAFDIAPLAVILARTGGGRFEHVLLAAHIGGAWQPLETIEPSHIGVMPAQVSDFELWGMRFTGGAARSTRKGVGYMRSGVGFLPVPELGFESYAPMAYGEADNGYLPAPSLGFDFGATAGQGRFDIPINQLMQGSGAPNSLLQIASGAAQGASVQQISDGLIQTGATAFGGPIGGAAAALATEFLPDEVTSPFASVIQSVIGDSDRTAFFRPCKGKATQVWTPWGVVKLTGTRYDSANFTWYGCDGVSNKNQRDSLYSASQYFTGKIGENIRDVYIPDAIRYYMKRFNNSAADEDDRKRGMNWALGGMQAAFAAARKGYIQVIQGPGKILSSSNQEDERVRTAVWQKMEGVPEDWALMEMQGTLPARFRGTAEDQAVFQAQQQAAIAQQQLQASQTSPSSHQLFNDGLVMTLGEPGIANQIPDPIPTTTQSKGKSSDHPEAKGMSFGKALLIGLAVAATGGIAFMATQDRKRN